MWDNEKLIGCGALKFLDKEHGEFKSIRIHDNFRKQGQGINVINHLINEAKKLKIKRLSIETGAGDFFIPARKLFKKTGFTICEPFAHYKEDSNSVYLSMFIDDIWKLFLIVDLFCWQNPIKSKESQYYLIISNN